MSAINDKKSRCSWCLSAPEYIDYHDNEWGVPEFDDQALFEKLILDGFQAGLSWLTILRKRDNFKRAFVSFDPVKIARFNSRDIKRLMNDNGIVRNRLKIESTIQNAKSWLKIQESCPGGFGEYLWQFTDGKTINNKWKTLEELPAKSPESIAMSKQLKSDGFRFCGPTICYAFMQAVGMVNDHVVDCFRYKDLNKRS